MLLGKWNHRKPKTLGKNTNLPTPHTEKSLLGQSGYGGTVKAKRTPSSVSALMIILMVAASWAFSEKVGFLAKVPYGPLTTKKRRNS